VVVLAVHVGATDLADELAGPGDGRPAGVQVVDAVAATAGLEVGVVVGVAGVRDGVGVDLAERVAQPDAEQRLADRPGDDLVDALVQPDGLLGVVEARGLVEVAGEEDRVALPSSVPTSGVSTSIERVRTSSSDASTSATGIPLRSSRGPYRT
jgi:hypothetical protein